MSDSEKKVVLIVDDAPANIQLISGVINGKYKVKAATSGAKALQIAQKLPSPDFILLDILMPEMDGYEVCRQLKSDPATSAIPVVFITGNASEEQPRSLEMGAIACLGKPVDSNQLLTLIEDTLV